MKRIAAILTSLVLVFSLAACGSQQAGTAAGSEAASTASSETASAAQTKTEEQLLAEENDILTANDELWEKVFASMDKNVTQTTLNNNYGDFLMDAVDNAKDQFTEEELTLLTGETDEVVLPSGYSGSPYARNIPGVATGRVVGGNMAVIGGLLGTPYSQIAPGTILLIEDIAEPIYKVAPASDFGSMYRSCRYKSL